MENFDCDLHVNYNCNFPECEESVVLQAIDLAKETGEALSNPFAVWAQTRDCLDNYIDPFNITAALFDTERVHPLDIHTMDDLLQAHREHQDLICPPSLKKT